VRWRAALLLTAWLPLCGASYTAHREVAAGNEALAAGDPNAALDHYARAGEADPDEAVIPYNVGTARLAAGDLDGAVEALGAAAGEPDSALPAQSDPVQARAAFNLGNAHLARAKGETERADLQAAVQAYRRAVAADPDGAAARKNLQIAATRLADLPPPQGEQQKNPSDQSKQGSQQQASQSSPSQGDPQQGQQPQDAGKPSRENEGADPAKGEAQAQGDKPSDEPSDKNGEAAGKGKLPEDVTRALAALRRKEAAVMREALRRGMGEPEAVEPDW